jgi:glutamine amidotransferase PdxT
MSRNDTSYGVQNYSVPLSLYDTSERVLYAPLVNSPGFPSPLFPLSTSTYPVALFITPSPDISGSVFDGHPFEVKFAAKFTTTASLNITLNMYQVTNAVLTSGITSTTYGSLVQASPSVTGLTKLVTGTATAANTTSGTITFSQQYTWDSTSKLLGINNAAVTYQKGVAISNTQSAATVASLAAIDLNFIPTFTLSATGTTVLTITEFVIDRI